MDVHCVPDVPVPQFPHVKPFFCSGRSIPKLLERPAMRAAIKVPCHTVQKIRQSVRPRPPVP